MERETDEGRFVFSPIEPVTPAAVEVNLWSYARSAACELKTCCERKKRDIENASAQNQSRIEQKANKQWTGFSYDLWEMLSTTV